MSLLTQKEKEALNDVFFAIQTEESKYERVKLFITTLLLEKRTPYLQKLLYQAKYGVKETNFSQYFLIFSKKKKNLSK